MTTRNPESTEQEAMVDGVLTVEGLQKTFGGVVALDEVDFAVQEGLITGIIGPNGAGKTTLYNVISGIIRPDEGRISLHGEEIQDLSSPEILLKALGGHSRPHGSSTACRFERTWRSHRKTRPANP